VNISPTGRSSGSSTPPSRTALGIATPRLYWSLTASELVALRWDDIDLATGRLHVRRAKSGDASVHPISARESRALRKLLREAPPSPYVFISERRSPLSVAGYQRMVARAGVAAKFISMLSD
jgi:integrase